MSALDLITEHLDIWTTAQGQKKATGRGKKTSNQGIYGIKKLRELILELAVRGKLVPQDPNDEPASKVLKKIADEKTRLLGSGKIRRQKTLLNVLDHEQSLDIPTNWIWTRLGIITQINPRNTVDDDQLVSFVPMPLISTSHTGEHGQEQRYWSEVKKGYTHFADGDIGLAKITPCFENSKAVVFSQLKNGIGAGTTELHIARPFGNTLNARFILLYLKSPQFLSIGQTKMTGTAGQKRVPKYFFVGHPLPLPPLAEQHRIVAKVDELMALCDQLEQQQTNSNATHQTLVKTLLAALTRPTTSADATETNAIEIFLQHFDTLFTTEQSIDQLKQTILQLAVMGRLVPQDPNDEPASNLLQKIAKEKANLSNATKTKKLKLLTKISGDEKPFELPIGWEWVRLGTIWQDSFYGPRFGKEKYVTTGGFPTIRTTDMSHDGIIVLKSPPHIAVPQSKFELYRLEKGDLLITRSGSIGKMAVYELNHDAIPSAYLIRIRFSAHINPMYILRFLLSPVGQGFLGLHTTSVGVPNVSATKMSHFPIPLPSLVEQRRIVAKIDELMAHCDTLKAQFNDLLTTQAQLANIVVKLYGELR